MDNLLRWAADSGVSDSPPYPASMPPLPCLGHSLSVDQFPCAGGRGLAATRELRRGELLLRVPRVALLTSGNVMERDGAIPTCVERHRHRLSSVQILTVCLLAEVAKGRNSWWYPYLVTLPRRYDTVANFTTFEIQALQVKDAIWVAEKAVIKAKLDWKKAIILMQELELKPQFLTLKSWLWASSTISSRTLHIPCDDAGCLCPVGDLFNYSAPEEGRCLLSSDDYTRLTDGGYEEDFSSYCFYARKKYRKGDQVFLSYGTYTNLELLEHYGFLLSKNLNDKVFIQLDKDMPCSWHKDSIYIHPDGTPSFALLCSLRLWAIPFNLRRSTGHQALTGSLLSPDNELIVMSWLAKQCTEILEKMPSSIDHDELLLQVIEKMLDGQSSVEDMDAQLCKQELFCFMEACGLQQISSRFPLKMVERWKLAVDWRVSHKKILCNCISYCSGIIDSLSSQCCKG